MSTLLVKRPSAMQMAQMQQLDVMQQAARRLSERKRRCGLSSEEEDRLAWLSAYILRLGESLHKRGGRPVAFVKGARE